jgi:hypothetical protein
VKQNINGSGAPIGPPMWVERSGLVLWCDPARNLAGPPLPVRIGISEKTVKTVG